MLPGGVVDLLVSSGVRLQVWRYPAELSEDHAEAGPINPDDLLDFHLLLQEDGWYDQLADLVDGA
jgi:hypothetical protein